MDNRTMAAVVKAENARRIVEDAHYNPTNGKLYIGWRELIVTPDAHEDMRYNIPVVAVLLDEHDMVGIMSQHELSMLADGMPND